MRLGANRAWLAGLIRRRRANRGSAAKRTLERALMVVVPLGARVWIDGAGDELDLIGLRWAAVGEGLSPAW